MGPQEAKKLGKYVKKEREARGLTLRDVADEVKVAASTILRIERGEFAAPTFDLLSRLARVLEVPVEEIHALTGEMVPGMMPELGSYMRTKYDLPAKAVAEIDQFINTLKTKYAGAKGKGGRRGKPRG